MKVDFSSIAASFLGNEAEHNIKISFRALLEAQLDTGLS